jgi:hypothetical protein
VCQVDYGDEPCRVWEEHWIKRSRKEHTCDTCHAPIPAGSRYFSLFLVTYDGDACQEAQCEACEKIADRFAKEHEVGKPSPASLCDYLDGCVDSGDADSERWKVVVAEIEDRRAAARVVKVAAGAAP